MDNIFEVKSYVRIREIEFVNFRNIENGKVSFPNTDSEAFLNQEPSVLGLYGQNGSGKSSVIMALSLLKDVLSGDSVNQEKHLSCIREGFNRCTLRFSFSIYKKVFDEKEKQVFSDNVVDCQDVFYDFDVVRKQIKDTDKLFIENEIIKVRTHDKSNILKSSKQFIFDTREECCKRSLQSFGNDSKFALFTNNYDESLMMNYRDAKIISEENSSSFVFSQRFYQTLYSVYQTFYYKNSEILEDKINNMAFQKMIVDSIPSDYLSKEELFQHYSSRIDKSFEEIDDLFDSDEAFDNFGKYLRLQQKNHQLITPIFLLSSLQSFGSDYLYIIDTSLTGITNLNDKLPLLLWNHTKDSNDQDNVFFQQINIDMNKPSFVESEKYEKMKYSIKGISEVLSKLIPDMRIAIQDLGTRLSNKNEQQNCFEMLSIRGSSTIPLKYESDGIRRLVSILSMLIAVYNEPSLTIAIDEIDSGIFEYLLGELISVLAGSLKGQLVFTSHNLRILEVLPSKFLCFTSTNPHNRFVTIPKRGNCNLRDTYIKRIVLGSPDESVYNHTDKYEIEFAFNRAGQMGDNEV